MLFHSREFLFYFLPIVYFGWLALFLARRQRLATAWLTVASLVFYGYWNPPYLILLAASLIGNFLVGKWVDPDQGRGQRRRFAVLTAGVIGNLALLGYFKYANFFVDTLNAAFDLGWTFEKVLLPLAISFFTFQQLAYLVDSYRGQAKGHTFDRYVFFVSFFPQLIAGPIVHHSEILPQARQPYPRARIPTNLLIGASIFVIGLFKKMVLADPCGLLASPFFDSVKEGAVYSSEIAWRGTLAYTFQIYFDFSGYSDMCIGLARIFGITLPENFKAPYRATSIVEFWRRWHITLSRFLRDYVYFPLGGNRRGKLLRYRNLLLTMLIGGLWHGAGWTFVIWGGIHGIYLSINHLWTEKMKRFQPLPRPLHLVGSGAGWALTMLGVIVAWVFFRADSVDSAGSILQWMAGHELEAASGVVPPGEFWESKLVRPWLILLAGIAIFAPTTQSYFREIHPVLEPVATEKVFWRWRPNLLHGLALGLMILLIMRKFFSLAPTEFLYFNF